MATTAAPQPPANPLNIPTDFVVSPVPFTWLLEVGELGHVWMWIRQADTVKALAFTPDEFAELLTKGASVAAAARPVFEAHPQA